MNNEIIWRCNRGISIRRSIVDSINNELVCLCPPGYYGHLCNHQNQRVSLTIQLQMSSDWRTAFAVIITLRDDQQDLIESYDKFNYLPAYDCNIKFNLYLLYGTRPKNISRNYFVRIDIYNKHTLEFRASWSFPILFPFLPVHRMAVHLKVPIKRIDTLDCENLSCGIHGHCRQYVNTNVSFCHCDNEWSGIYCNISHICYCSPGSVCLDSKICLCPLGKFGSRCYLEHPMCPCNNGGTCTQNDELMSEEDRFRCICPDGFSGSRCEIIDTSIVISFGPNVLIPASVHVHFIEVFRKEIRHIRTTTFRKIALDQDTITVYKSSRFHIVFVETKPYMYYLSVLQLVYIPSIRISSMVTQSKQCLSINELFNSSFITWHLLRRMKYYHVPCKEHANLACFYDHDNYMCLCNKDLGQANCFEFVHNMTYNCQGRNPCQHNGKCFQDDPKCPSSSACVCDDCSYGSLCQFSTNSFDLSLDVILGYQIRPNISFGEQRSIIKVIISIVILMFICGLLNSILCLMTFQGKKTREVGCGYYLLTSSCISILVTIMFVLKFSILIASQMSLITNKIFLSSSCKSMEYILKVLVNTTSWLYACVSSERAILAIKDTKFNQIKNQQVAKWIITFICIFTITTHIQDPIYRDLINDKEEKRTWCIIQLTPSIQLFNSIILFLHFFLPFLLNIFSAFIIIINVTRRRSTAQRQQTYLQHLRKQFHELKHLLISPCVLILLSFPQIIISFMSGCMKSPRNPWMYLIANFMSYLPSMITFIIFVIPSDTYRNELGETIKRINRHIHRH